MLVKGLPIVIKALCVICTIALLLVSGGIFVHNIAYFHDLLPAIPAIIKELAIGLIIGLLVVVVVTLCAKVIAVVKAK